MIDLNNIEEVIKEEKKILRNKSKNYKTYNCDTQYEGDHAN